MKNYYSSILIILSIIITLFSCVKEDNYIAYKNKVIVPLSEIKTWTYKNYYYNSSKKDSLTEAVPVKLKLFEKILIKNEDWYPFSYFQLDYACTNRKDGLWSTKCDFKNKIISEDSTSLLFKYPAKISDIWYSNYLHDSIKIISLEEIIKVPKGTYKCIHYQTKNFRNYLSGSYYVAPGIGIVRCEIVMGFNKTDNSPTLWNILELADYE